MIDSYRIIEATRDTRHAGDCCYFVVEFLEGGNGTVVCVEDFQMPNLKETANIPVVDVGGNFVLADGTKLKKSELEAALQWIPTEIKRRIDEAERTVLAGLEDDVDPADGHITTHPTRRAVYEKIHEEVLADPQAAAANKQKLIKRQTIPLDVARTIEENIERHIATLNSKGLRGDRRDKTIRPSDKQAIGISQRADVLMLRAKIKTVQALAPIVGVKL